MVKSAVEHQKSTPQLTAKSATDYIIMPGDHSDVRNQRFRDIRMFDAIWVALKNFYSMIALNKALLKETLNTPRRKSSTPPPIAEGNVHQRLGGVATYSLETLKDDLIVWFTQSFHKVKQKAHDMINKTKTLSTHQQQYMTDCVNNSFKDDDVRLFATQIIDKSVDEVNAKSTDDPLSILKEMIKPLATKARQGQRYSIPQELQELICEHYACDLLHRSAHQYHTKFGNTHGDVVFFRMPDTQSLVRDILSNNKAEHPSPHYR